MNINDIRTATPFSALFTVKNTVLMPLVMDSDMKREVAKRIAHELLVDGDRDSVVELLDLGPSGMVTEIFTNYCIECGNEDVESLLADMFEFVPIHNLLVYDGRIAIECAPYLSDAEISYVDGEIDLCYGRDYQTCPEHARSGCESRDGCASRYGTAQGYIVVQDECDSEAIDGLCGAVVKADLPGSNQSTLPHNDGAMVGGCI